MRIWTAAIFAAVLSGTVDAQENLIGTISRNNGSVLEVLKAGKCQEGWLSQVLLDSNIRPSEFRHLHRGKEVILKGKSCEDIPPRATREATALFLRGQRRATKASPQIPPPDTHDGIMSELKDKLANAEKRLAGLQLQDPPSGLKQGALTQTARANPVPALLVGALIALVIAYIAFYKWKAGKLVVDERRTVWFLGEQSFLLKRLSREKTSSSAFEETWVCKLCGKEVANGQAYDFRKHLEESHPEMRSDNKGKPVTP